MDDETALAAAKSLPREEQIRLVQEIWDSIADEQVPLEITPELAAEVDRRIAEAEPHPERCVTWDEVEATLRSSPQRGGLQ